MSRGALRPVVLALFAGAALAAACSGGSGEDARSEDARSEDARGEDARGEDARSEDAPTEQRPLELDAVPVSAGSPRTFAMGFMAIPASLSESAYVRVFDVAAEHGDLIMILRGLPWAEVGPGAHLLPATEATIQRETALVRERDLELLFAIDPWEPTDRGRLVGDAPGDSFTDPAVVEAYLAYVELVVTRYRPRWLALAVDLDQFAVAQPADVRAFHAAYIRAYRRVKELAPETRVFATFQLEDLQGLLPWGEPHAPQWSLILRFAPVLDVLAFSTFPSFLFPFPSDIPNQYYSRLNAFAKPIALVPVGYASDAGRAGVTYGTPGGQRRFLERLLAETGAAPWALVVWLAPDDPQFATAGPYDLLSHMGLRDGRGAAKPAWTVWAEQARRPWAPLPFDAGLAADADGGLSSDAEAGPVGAAGDPSP